MSEPNEYDEGGSLPPEQEAIVRQFTQQLDGDGNMIMMVNTRVGMVKMSADDEVKIREAARDKTIELIRFTPPTAREQITGWIGTAIGALLLVGLIAVLAKLIFF